MNAPQWNLWAAGLLSLVFSASAAPPPPAFQITGAVEDAFLSELSGLAVSRLEDGRWWGNNDSGHPAELYAVDPSGRARGSLVLPAPSVDWEDIASYRHDGQAWLAVADTGDNFGFRGEVAIYIVAEPEKLDPARPVQASAVREIRFRYADGARDCESLAADPAHGRFLLIDKSRQPAGLYEVPMQPPPGPVVARRIADLPFLWQGPIPPVSPTGASRYRGSATAMDVSADGLRMLVMTYSHLTVFERRPDEDWAPAFAREPLRLQPLPRQRLMEAAGFDVDGRSALVSGEGVHASLQRWNGKLPAP